MKRQVVAAGKLRRDVVMKMRGKDGYNNGSVLSPEAAWLPDILERIPAGRSRAAEAVHRASSPVAKKMSTAADSAQRKLVHMDPPPRGMTAHYTL